MFTNYRRNNQTLLPACLELKLRTDPVFSGYLARFLRLFCLFILGLLVHVCFVMLRLVPSLPSLGAHSHDRHIDVYTGRLCYVQHL